MAAHPAPPGARVNLTLLSAVVLLILAVSLFGGEDSSSDTSRPPNARHAPQAAPASPTEEAAPVERPADRRQRAPRARPLCRRRPVPPRPASA